MKRFIILFAAVTTVFTLSCNNTEVPVVYIQNNYVNPYAGTYHGLFTEDYNGVDSDGVFKGADSFEYDMVVTDQGVNEIKIEKGSYVFDHLPVDSNGYFSTDSPYVSSDSLNYSLNGQFRNDSLYIDYKAINGGYNPDWFSIVHLTFRGKKTY